MAFELLILLCTVALPATVTAVAFTVAFVFPKSIRASSSLALTALGGTISIWLAACLRNGFAVWPPDSWLRVPIGALLVALAGSATLTGGPKESRWIVRSVAILIATWLVLPGGDGFSDLLPSIPRWQLCMALAAILGWWVMERVEDRYVLTVTAAWIVLMGAGTFLIAQSFAKLTEIMLAVGTVCFIVGLIALWKGRVEFVRVAAGPILFAFVAAVSNGQFNSFLGLPDWLSVLAFTSPTIVAIPLLFPQTRLPCWSRVAILWSLAFGIATTVVGFSLSFHGGDQW